MKEIKYTTDGRKVVVIGNLNTQEKIVQEVFVTDEGAEIPSGENFVVTSLHDSPVISWKEKEIGIIEARYDKIYKQYHDATKDLEKRHRNKCSELRAKMSYLIKVINTVSENSFETLINFLTDDIKYIVESGYNISLIDYKDFRCDYDSTKLKLITLFGSDDGTLTWGINRYSDGSGGNDMYYVFTNKEDAIEKLSYLLLERKSLYERDIILAKKYNIELDAAKIEEFQKKRTEEYEKNLDSHKKSVDTYKQRIKDVKTLKFNVK